MTMTEQTTVENSPVLRDRAGKYLTFVLAGEEYGLEILKVREIIQMMNITAVPRTPDYVQGVINLRGKVIPVVDLRRKMGLPDGKRTEETCIIVVDIGEIEMGTIVDRVSEVLDIAAEDIDESPSFGASVNTDFILGMGKSHGRVTTLLDIALVLSGDDARSLRELADGADAPEDGAG
jgi:purine-binding chemotaxis protein CheW